MACNHENDAPTRTDSPCCKCSPPRMAKAKTSPCTSGSPTDRCRPLLKHAVNKYKDRRQELDERHRALSDKITVMERSVPALMALNMLKNKDCDESDGVEIVREMMRKLAPEPAAADKLVADLATCVEQLNCETAKLNHKIENAEKQLKESCMELESLEQVNRELEEQIRCMEAKSVNQTTSIEPISSDERLCLARIRQLGEDELRMKRNIRELEQREATLRCQIEKILGARQSHDSKPKHCQAVVQTGQHHVYNRTRKKECLKSEQHKNCEKPGCEAPNKMCEQDLPMVSKSQKYNTRKKSSCEQLAPRCGSTNKSQKDTSLLRGNDIGSAELKKCLDHLNKRRPRTPLIDTRANVNAVESKEECSCDYEKINTDIIDNVNASSTNKSQNTQLLTANDVGSAEFKKCFDHLNKRRSRIPLIDTRVNVKAVESVEDCSCTHEKSNNEKANNNVIDFCNK